MGRAVSALASSDRCDAGEFLLGSSLQDLFRKKAPVDMWPDPDLIHDFVAEELAALEEDDE